MKKKLVILLILIMTGNIIACGGTKEVIDEPIQESVTESVKFENESDTASTEATSNITLISNTETPVEEEDLSDSEIFLNFINGETDAMFAPDFQESLNYICKIYDYESEESYYTFDITNTVSYEQLVDAVGKSDVALLDLSKTKKYYAIFNIGSGSELLALKFQNLNIYSEGDDSYALFVLAVNSGQLYITYAYDSWDRNCVDIYDNLIFNGLDSGGAGLIHKWCNYIDETGHCKSIYDMTSLYDDWVANHDWETFSGDTEWSRGCSFSLLETDSGNYYSYEAPDSVDSEKLALFISHLEENGKIKTDDIDAIINAAFEENSLSLENVSIFEDWIPCD
jgi:hypothetical protein